MPQPPTRLSSTRRLLFALLSTLLLLGGAEAVARLAGPAPGPIYTARPDVRWGIETDLVNAAFTSPQTGASFSVSTNPEGLRTPYPAVPATDGTFTVLMLGDSRVFGWGVEGYQTIAAGLEASLMARMGRSVRVVNGGVPGYSSVQSLMLLETRGLMFQPDVVVWEISHHNFRSSPEPDSRAYDMDRTSRLGWFFASHSALYRVVRGRLLALLPPPEMAPVQLDLDSWGDSDPNSDAVRVPRADLERALARAAELAEQHDFQLSVYFPPEFDQAPEQYLSAVRQAQGPRLHWLAVHQPFVGAGGLSYEAYLTGDPGHFSAAGSALVGQVLADALAEQGLLR